ncbi:uncharacterized protein LOC105189501 [Harpegnathos saltator]|uniref:uncharacterized protein LOC105189501 n=1 Tax=Harpegnathos saltator TaxID=610380 RepID=UPI00058CFBAC|nr:uncharacterized protein LOC105189501 [Harpegnathos saltator]
MNKIEKLIEQLEEAHNRREELEDRAYRFQEVLERELEVELFTIRQLKRSLKYVRRYMQQYDETVEDPVPGPSRPVDTEGNYQEAVTTGSPNNSEDEHSIESQSDKSETTGATTQGATTQGQTNRGEETSGHNDYRSLHNKDPPQQTTNTTTGTITHQHTTEQASRDDSTAEENIHHTGSCDVSADSKENRLISVQTQDPPEQTTDKATEALIQQDDYDSSAELHLQAKRPREQL